MWRWGLIVMCLLLAGPGAAQNKAQVQRQFAVWLEQTVWPRAARAGVTRPVFEQAMLGVTLNWELPDLVPPGAQQRSKGRNLQTEFGVPARYFARGSVDGATRVGRQMAQRHARALQSAERKTGVPGHIVLAIWGRESAYGKARILHDLFEVLGTKAFMSTRAAFFTEELIAALQIAEQLRSPERLKSSWAGALGQPQFMPSSYLKYAEDGDGDGVADIWRSEADTIASIAAYLKRHGWQTGRDWGFEVSVPASVSCTLEGPDQGRAIRDWEKLGIRRVSAKPFPKHELRGEGYLMMPAGRLGPAFVVTPNFYVLKDYNTSDLYALFVGHIGDRIAYGQRDFSGAWAKIPSMRRADIARAQNRLERLGHDVGGVDGLPGFRTRRSIGRWQEAQGQAATCFPSPGVLRAITAR